MFKNRKEKKRVKKLQKEKIKKSKELTNLLEKIKTLYNFNLNENKSFIANVEKIFIMSENIRTFIPEIICKDKNFDKFIEDKFIHLIEEKIDNKINKLYQDIVIMVERKLELKSTMIKKEGIIQLEKEIELESYSDESSDELSNLLNENRKMTNERKENHNKILSEVRKVMVKKSTITPPTKSEIMIEKIKDKFDEKLKKEKKSRNKLVIKKNKSIYNKKFNKILFLNNMEKNLPKIPIKDLTKNKIEIDFTDNNIKLKDFFSFFIKQGEIFDVQLDKKITIEIIDKNKLKITNDKFELICTTDKEIITFIKK